MAKSRKASRKASRKKRSHTGYHLRKGRLVKAYQGRLDSSGRKISKSSRVYRKKSHARRVLNKKLGKDKRKASKKKSRKPCKSGKVRDRSTGKCRPKKKRKASRKKSRARASKKRRRPRMPCKSGKVRDRVSKKCRSKRKGGRKASRKKSKKAKRKKSPQKKAKKVGYFVRSGKVLMARLRSGKRVDSKGHRLRKGTRVMSKSKARNVLQRKKLKRKKCKYGKTKSGKCRKKYAGNKGNLRLSARRAYSGKKKSRFSMNRCGDKYLFQLKHGRKKSWAKTTAMSRKSRAKMPRKCFAGTGRTYPMCPKSGKDKNRITMQGANAAYSRAMLVKSSLSPGGRYHGRTSTSMKSLRNAQLASRRAHSAQLMLRSRD